MLYEVITNKGEGFQPDNRVLWSHQLNSDEAKKYTIKHVLGENHDNSKPEWYEVIK